MTRNEVLTLQRQLNAEGYALVLDGVYGPNTARAYQEWLNANTPEVVTTPAPNPVTPWWRHKVVLGLLATVLAGFTSRWGIEGNELTDILLKIAEAAGLLLAAWGTAPSRATGVDPRLIVRGVRYADTTYPVPPDGPTDKPAGPFGY